MDYCAVKSKTDLKCGALAKAFNKPGLDLGLIMTNALGNSGLELGRALTAASETLINPGASTRTFTVRRPS
jgi:hypothetical protein